MGAFVDTLIQLFIDWGYPGIFIACLLAGSVVPFTSEIIVVTLIKLGLDPILCLFFAALGNTAGGMSCYYMGRIGKIEWIEKYFKVKKERVEKMQLFLQGKGALMAFFTFLPFFGEVIAITLGFMRSNVWFTTLSMFTGKLVRYIVIVMAVEEIIKLAWG